MAVYVLVVDRKNSRGRCQMMMLKTIYIYIFFFFSAFCARTGGLLMKEVSLPNHLLQERER
jgi:hypothetical protein